MSILVEAPFAFYFMSISDLSMYSKVTALAEVMYRWAQTILVSADRNYP